MERISSFPPIIFPDSRILILGSVPGVKSLAMQQYYAHPQNLFWKILYHIFEEDFSADYLDRIKLLKDNKVAVWDTIESCERAGSLDSDIKNEQANDILNLLKDHPNVSAIFCNGQKSYKNLIRLVGKDFPLPVIALPSTSPAFASMRFEDKFSQWQQIKNYL